jgi:hypothetical protein
MKYREHRDKLYLIEEREQLLIQLNESLWSENKDLSDKIDCLQRSQVYIHNHISQVEKAVDQIRRIILGLNIYPLETYPGELI